MGKPRALLSWSSGKDSAWCLHTLNRDPTVTVSGLITTFNSSADRVAMHAVRRHLVRRQANAAGLPLVEVELPWPCSNADYEAALGTALEEQRAAFDVIAFGDLFLEDVREYREKQLAGWGFEPVFPLWLRDTSELSRQMVDEGLSAVLTCVDPKQCPAEFVGRRYNAPLLDELPESVDPCGERGEFHTFVSAGPMFDQAIDISVGEIVERDGFVFADVR